MGYHWIITSFASAVLIIIATGCATQRTGAESNLADPAAAITASQLSGTWRGESWPIGTDSTSVLNRDVTLEVKDDATYRLISTRQGTGTASNDSGVAVPDGGTVVLRSSTGQSIRLQRNGDKMHGVVTSSGRPMNIMLERAR
jgi:hypothetical protein